VDGGKRTRDECWGGKTSEESVSAVSVNRFKQKLQKMYTDGLFPRIFILYDPVSRAGSLGMP